MTGDNILHHMGMGANDGMAPVVEEPLSQRLLIAVVAVLVFDTPMDKNNDKISFLTSSLQEVATYDGGIDQIDHIGLADFDTIGAIGIAQQGQTYALAVDNQRMLFGTVAHILVGAQMKDLEGVEDIDGPFQSAAASVQAMVVGGGEDIESRLTSRCRKGIGCREAGIACIGFPSQSHLQIGDGNVGTADVILHIAEGVTVVVRAILEASAVVDGHMAHQVASKDKAQRSVCRLGSSSAHNKQHQKHQAEAGDST